MTSSLDRSLKGNFFTRYLLRNLSEALPKKAKRMLYVCSAAGLLLKTKHPDLKLVTRLNQDLSLAHSDSGLLFPVYIGGKIWEGVMEEQVFLEHDTVRLSELEPKALADIDCWKAAVFFAKNSPSWLKYGSVQLMTSDIHDLLISLRRTAA